MTAPIFGAVLSGYVGSKIGGYTSKYALPSCIFAGSVCVVVACAVPFTDDFRALIFLIWMLLFAGGYILPCMTGIMLNQVEPHLRASANSMANFSYNLLGYLPAPALYGAVCSITGGKYSKWGMILLMYMTIPCFFFLCAAYFFANRYEKKKAAEKALNKAQGKQYIETPQGPRPRIMSFGIDHEFNSLTIGIPKSFVLDDDFITKDHPRYYNSSVKQSFRKKRISLG